MSSDGSHRAEKDTENCGMIFQELVHEAASYPLEIISKILDITSSINASNNDLFFHLAEELKVLGNINSGITKSNIEKTSYNNVYNNKGINDISAISVNDVFKDKGLLSDLIKLTNSPIKVSFSSSSRFKSTYAWLGETRHNYNS